MSRLTPEQKLETGWYWRVPAARELVHPALTEENLRQAEALLGVQLPAAYVALLRLQNGGALRATWPACYSEALWGIGEGPFSITRDGARWGPRSRPAGPWAPRRSELLVPFDGGDVWDVCLDYRRAGPHGEPSVMLVDRECEEEEPLAASFARYLAGLVDRLAGSFRIAEHVEPADFARTLARTLGAPPPQLEAGAGSGVPRWRIALRGDHQWCWVSPNRVPAWADGRATADGAHACTATALQVPEEAGCVLLVSCTAESRAAVQAALRTR